MDRKIRAQIYDELNLRDTDDLIKIWREKNLDEFEESTFVIIQEILQSRLGYLPAQSIEVQVDDLLDRIQDDLLAGKLDKAFSDCKLAIKMAPECAEAYNYRGIIHEKRGNLENAISDFQKALQCDPLLTAAKENLETIEQEVRQNILGRVEKYLEEGEYDKALEDCQLAIRMAPELAVAYNFRGVIYDEWGRLTEAVKDYQKALQLDPELADAQENLEIAEQELEEEFQRSSSKRHLDRASAHLTNEKIEKALAECELASRGIPRLPLLIVCLEYYLSALET
jgi:tetratricopeptide (TPR) repeat protein